ncbi:Opine dehydrogenase [subsurface metagenome]
MIQKVAVLGGGNGAHAMAADLTLKGFEVNICEAPQFIEGFRATLEHRQVNLIDLEGNEKTVKLHMATTNFEEALQDVDYIMMAMAASGHEYFFNSIIPYLRDGQTIVTWPGYFSALLFTKILKGRGIKKNITLAEAHTFPFACRLVGQAKVKKIFEAWKILVSTLPARNRDRVVQDLRRIYPVVSCPNTLATSLNDPNPIVHPVVMVLNAVSVDIKEDFHFYRDGITLPVSRAIRAVYDEVANVAHALDVEVLEYPEESFWSKSGIMSVYFKVPFDKEGAAASIDGPHSLKNRFITEDIPFGLVPTALLAHEFRIPIPTVDAVIQLSSILNDTNYWEVGYSLEDLGLAGLSIKEINQFLETEF